MIEQPTAGELARICEIIVDDGKPFYVAVQSELPERLRLPDRVGASTGRLLDRALERWLTDRGAWSGGGHAILLNDEVIASRAADLSESTFTNPDAHRRNETLGFTAHELSHVCDRRPTSTDILTALESMPRAADFCEALVARWNPDDAADVAADGRPPWTLSGNHGASFIRTLCHIISRVESMLSEPISRSLAIPEQQYGLIPLWKYQRTLRDEIAAQWQTPLQKLHDIKPPEPFVRLWRSNVMSWFNRTPGADVQHVIDAMSPYVPQPKD